MALRFSFRFLLPLLVLLLIEGGSLWLISPAVLPITAFSAVVAGLVLLAGVLPAVLKPGGLSLLAGCFAVLLACVLFLPPARPFNPFPNVAPLDILSDRVTLWRMANSILLAPTALHLALRVGGRSTGWRWLGVYLVSGLGFIALLWLPPANPWWLFLRNLLALWFIVLVVAAIITLGWSARHPDVNQPRAAWQGRILFFTVLISQAPVPFRLMGLALGQEWIPYDLLLAAQVFFPLGVAYTVLRHDLFDIDAILRRAFGYALASLVVLALYFGLVVIAAALLSQMWWDYRGLAAALAIFGAALAFEPLRGGLQRRIDRWFYPERERFRTGMAAARETLSTVARREDILYLLCTTLPAALGAAWGEVVMGAVPQPPRRSGAHEAWNAPLITAGTCLGGYWLAQRTSGLRYDAGEQAELTALAQQAALALAYALTFEALEGLNRDLEQRVAERTAESLQQQRTLAITAERQRLARDLHDSISQALFSMSLSARALRTLARQDPGALGEELSILERSAQDAQLEMRALLEHLRSASPETTSEQALLDLAAMLSDHVRRLRDTPVGLEVNLQTPAVLLLPAGLALDLFQAGREALHNVLKHAGVRKAACVLSLNGGRVYLVVRDEGRGFAAGEERGVGHLGLKGMSERLAAYGGQVAVESQAGQGTVVTMTVALPEEER